MTLYVKVLDFLKNKVLTGFHLITRKDKNMILPIKKIEKSNIVGCIYGRPGVGKTTLLSNIPKAVFIGTEANELIDCLKHPDGPSKSYKDFLEKLQWALDLPEDVCDTIVIDTISEVEILMINSFLVGKQNINTAMGGYGAGYQELKKLYYKLFYEHVKKAKKDIIFIARQIKAEETDEETGNTYTKTYPMVEKNRVYEFFAGEMDFIFSIKQLSPKQTGKQDSFGAGIYTMPSVGGDAKNRFGLKDMYFWPRQKNVVSVWPKIKADIDTFFKKRYDEKKEKPEKEKPKNAKPEKEKSEKKDPKTDPNHPANEAFDLMHECLKKKIKVTSYPYQEFLKQKPERLEKFKEYYIDKLSKHKP